MEVFKLVQKILLVVSSCPPFLFMSLCLSLKWKTMEKAFI